MHRDIRGHTVTLSDAAALQPYERALEAMRTYRGDPLAPLDEAIAVAPDFAAAHATKALALMTLFERRFSELALGALDAGSAAIEKGTARERSLAAAARLLATGEWQAGSAALDRHLAENPRDIVALQVGHLVDFARGDSRNLRDRVARVMPSWSAGVPGYSFVVGMHSFGLEECDEYAAAEAAGRRALELAPEDCWATHAVTHVYEMQGRIDAGIRFLEDTKSDWAAPDNGFAFHNWWHLALFHLDRGDHARALDVYDQVLVNAHELSMSRLDATSLLWRLRLERADVGSRFDVVADSWEKQLEGEGGFYSFNDFHAALAFAATGRAGAIARLRAILDAAAAGKDDNAQMTRLVGREVSEAAIAYTDGRFGEAADRLLAARDGAWRFGGSHAQRDVLTLTLIDAAHRAGRTRVAEHFAAERVKQKPTAQWGQRLLERVRTPARGTNDRIAIAERT